MEMNHIPFSGRCASRLMGALLAGAAICVSAPLAFAQYDQDISVEGKYVPEFIPRDRIGVFPTQLRFEAVKSTLPFSLDGVTYDFAPRPIPIPATTWGATREIDSHRGYVSLGMGSWLESTLSAGYRFIDTDRSVLGVRLQHNSTSLWKAKTGPDTHTPMRRYDEMLGIYGSHTFDSNSRLEAAADWHLGNFNYYGFCPEWTAAQISVPTQTLNDAAVRLGWYSAPEADNISWSLGAGAGYFGYRRFYALPQSQVAQTTPAELASTGGSRETDVNINGTFRFPTSAKSALGIDMDAHLLCYADQKLHGLTPPAVSWERPQNYGIVTLSPYYRLSRTNLDIRIGAEIDLAFNAGPENSPYRTFHIAPDVRLDWKKDAFALYMAATGGSELLTLASRYERDYYQSPLLANTAPVYTPLDSRIGMNFGPFSGFSAGAEFSYRIQKGQELPGFYTTWLNGQTSEDVFSDTRTRLHGWSAGLNAGYDSGRYFKARANAHWQQQSGTTGFFNGLDRPRWIIKAEAESNPWSTLCLRLGYDYRGVRSAGLENLRLPDITSLNFGASYKIDKMWGVWVQADNLLNCHWDYLPGLPEPGLRLAAGLDILF